MKQMHKWGLPLLTGAVVLASVLLPRQISALRDRQTLNDFLETQTGVWAVWLKDLETGKTSTYNETYAYYPASLLKAPFVYWLCLRADAGEINLEGTWFTNEWKGTLAGTPW